MAIWTPTADLPAPPRTRPHVLIWIAGALLLILLGAAAYGYYIAHSALPQLDGKISLPDLSAPVTVTRDAHGVPTIEAKTLEDLFYAQGYVTAQDRLWQMDVMRRFAAGEMSEILGPSLIEHDREQRILGLREIARKSAGTLSARDRSYFEAYARGVTAFLSTHQDRLPIEFRLLGYKPKTWTVEDCLLLGARLVQDLNHGTYKSALVREKVLAKLGPELTADLYVNTSWRDRPPSAKNRQFEEETHPGSNNPDDDEEMDSGADSNVARARPSAACATIPAASGGASAPSRRR